MSTTLVIVRHGQTDWNKEERFRGRSDLPLNEFGLRQAEAVAARIAADFGPAAIFAGPLLRARATAEAIGRQLKLEPRINDGLLDLDYGDFAGLSPAEAEERYPQVFRSWVAAPQTVRFPQGESLSDVQSRVMGLVDHLSPQFPDQQVVLVSHLVVCRVLLCSLLHLPLGHFSAFEIHPASLSVVRLEADGACLLTVNDTCHLRDMAHTVA